MDQEIRSASPIFDEAAVPQRLALLKSRLASVFKKYKIKIVDDVMVEEDDDCLYKCMVCYSTYESLDEGLHLLRLPYCDHCLFANCFIRIIETSDSDANDLRVQVRSEETGTFDNNNAYFMLGTFSHKFFKCPFCRMGHLIDQDVFMDIELHVRNLLLEKDNMDKESHKVRYLKALKDCGELMEKKRELQNEVDKLKEELNNKREEMEKMEKENSDLKSKMERDKEFYGRSLASLNFYRAFYCDQNIIVKMGKRIDELTEKLGVIGLPKSRKRKREGRNKDAEGDYNVGKRAKRGRESSSGEGKLKRGKDGNVVLIYESSLSPSSPSGSEASEASTFCSDVEKHSYGVDVSVKKYIENINEYT